MLKSTVSRLALFAAAVGLSLPITAQDGGERPERGPRDGAPGDRGPGERGPRDGERGPREGRPEDGGGRFGGRGGFGGGDFNPAEMIRRFNPLFAAIDKDEDGSLSASEIEAAVASIKALDKDGDGNVSAEEVRPQFGGPGGGPGGRPGFGPPRDGDRPEGGPGGGNPMVDRMKQMDTNGDGKLTKEELGERAERMLQFGDTNSDGVIDTAEIEQMARRAMGGRGGQGGQGGGRPGGEGGGRPPRPEAE